MSQIDLYSNILSWKGLTLFLFEVHYALRKIKIMEAVASHDFGTIWLGVVLSASDFKEELCEYLPSKKYVLCIKFTQLSRFAIM